MPRLLRVDSADPTFMELVRHLDAELAIRDGSDHAYYAQFNRIESIKYVVVAYDYDKAVACGAIKEFEAGSMPGAIEVKRMYTLPESRGKGIAAEVLAELERWSAELSFDRCVLETGLKQPEAIRLYKKSGYVRIPNYGQYVGMDNSVCFEKKLSLSNGPEYWPAWGSVGFERGDL
ncbi:MAG: GNAT family N-acetyltransferase [Acidobacteria bacterium]|nr:GNAT family N-acetyltransferase [Acidobacteriota bacterium]